MKLKKTIIKALLLGTGLAIGMLMIAKVCYEMSHDKCYSDYGQIYRIRTLYTQHGEDYEYDNVSGAVAPGFKQYVPGVETATRWTFMFNSDRFIDEDKNVIEGKNIVVDSCFFDVFGTEILAGNPKEAFSEIASAMVSKSFAEKLCGVSESIGKVIYNEEMTSLPITIKGVFKDFPHHSSIRNDVLISMETIVRQSTENWLGNDRYKGYVRLAKGTDPDMLAPAIRQMQEKNYPPEIKQMETSGIDIHYFLSPLSGMEMLPDQTKNMIVILTMAAVLLIIISLLNYVLISVSALVERSKEMGVRKCYGADGKRIYGIMAKEAIADITAALVATAVIILSLRSAIQDLIGVPLSALMVGATYGTIATILAVVFVMAALVPGYLYSKIPAGAAIRKYKENKKTWKLALLFVQIGICTLLLTLMYVISAQYDKAVNDKPGYEYKNLLWTVLTGTDNGVHNGIIDELKTVPGVIDVQMSFSLPLDYSSGNNILLPGTDYKELFNIADQYEGTAGLFEMLEIPFIEGRYPQTADEVAVSESFVKKMMEFQDWSDGAVGKRIAVTEHSQTPDKTFTISGVYKDYRINTLTDQDTRASIKFYGEVGKNNMSFMAIKVEEVSPEMMAKVEEVIQARIENKDVVVKSYKDSMRQAYSSERRMRNTIITGCIVSIIIALFGLIGYVRNESQRRSKEMAVRKINGATIKEIIGIYVGEIIKLSIPAIILGNVGAWFAASAWLKSFSEKIALSPWYFILADIVIIAVVSFCVVTNSLRISRSNPVESLKNE